MCREPLNVWILIDSRQIGGIESHVIQLASGLLKLHIQPKVLLLKHYGEHPLTTQLEKADIPYEYLDGGLTKLIIKVKQEQPDLIHTHGYKSGIVGRVASLLCFKPVVSSFHAGEVSNGKLKLYDFIDRYTAFLANKVISVSDKIAAKLPCHSLVIDNFVNTQHFKNSDGKQIAFVGRLSHEKGADYFLQLANQFPNHLFHIYGDGPLMQDLKEIAPTNIQFHGALETMDLAWQNIELLIICSRYEGLPLAALEAMGRGIPVMASQVGGLPKLIDHQKNGWLFSVGDLNSLTSYLSDWLQMPLNDRQRYQQRAKQRIDDQFSSQKVVPKVALIYRHLTQKSGAHYE